MDAAVNTRRDRLVLKHKDKASYREIKLHTEPINYLINWVADAYGFKATIKPIWWIREDAVEEKIH